MPSFLLDRSNRSLFFRLCCSVSILFCIPFILPAQSLQQALQNQHLSALQSLSELEEYPADIHQYSDLFLTKHWTSLDTQPSLAQHHAMLGIHSHFAQEQPSKWLIQKALWAMYFGVADSLPNILDECMRQIPYDVPFVVGVSYVEAQPEWKTDAANLQTQSRLLLRMDEWLTNYAFLHPNEADDAFALRERLADRVRQFLPPCLDLVAENDALLSEDLLKPNEYRELFLHFRLLGCEGDLQDTIASRNATFTNSLHEKRIVARQLTAEGEYVQAIELLLTCEAQERHPQIQARDQLSLARLYMLRKNFRTSRLYAQKASENAPEWGRPELFLAELITQSAPLCHFKRFERKAIYWLAIDYCEQALNRNPSLETEASQMILSYQKKAPSREEVQFRGLNLGDSYPIKCWMSEATRVRY